MMAFLGIVKSVVSGAMSSVATGLVRSHIRERKWRRMGVRGRGKSTDSATRVSLTKIDDFDRVRKGSPW